MTILQALDRYYDRLDDAVRPGWSREKFGWCVVIDAGGELTGPPLDLSDNTGKKSRPKLYVVPAGAKRTAGIAPNFLWDKTSYVLGRTGGEGKRTEQEHAAFVALHRERLAGSEDEGLVALLRFLDRWTPDRFDAPPFGPEMLDANILFRLEGDGDYLHNRPAACALVEATVETAPGNDILCLVTGERGAPARLHPNFKGVEGAQSSGASLVSFNLDAFESYGQSQGANAPTSEAAAFRYGEALKRLLTRDGPNRVRRPIGDATTVFWADASDAEAGAAADAWLAAAVSMEVTDEQEAAKLSDQLEAVARGAPVATIHPGLVPGTRMHVLGLAPNAARLSVRYWITDPLEDFARRLQRHRDDLAIKPVPHGWGAGPSVNLLLARTTALMGKFENIPDALAGEVMRAVLAGTPYPLTLLTAALIRLRAGDDPGSGWHAAVIRAVLSRLPDRHKETPPVSLTPDFADPGYQLGRLFAVYESAQRAALGFNVNATIRDKYFAAASATPAGVFPLIMKNGQNHLAKVRKEKPGLAVVIERELDEIIGRLDPQLPRSLGLQSQGGFAIGYYHQRQAQYAKPDSEEEQTK